MAWLCLVSNLLIGIRKLLSGPPKLPLLQTKQAQLPSSSSQGRCSSPCIFVYHCWTHSFLNIPVVLDLVLLMWSTCSAEGRVITASFISWPCFCWYSSSCCWSSSLPGACWLLFYLFASPRTPRFIAWLRSSSAEVIACAFARGYSIAGVGLCISSLWISSGSLLACPFGWQRDALEHYQLTSFICKLMKGAPIPSYRSLIRVLNRTSLWIDCWGTWLVTGLLVEWKPLTMTHSAWWYSQLFAHPIAHLSVP